MKKDSSIRNITLAAVRRTLIDSAKPAYTQMFEDAEVPAINIQIHDSELPIAVTVLPNGNFSLITTQRIVSFVDKQTFEIGLTEINQFHPGDFKGGSGELVTTGSVKAKTGEIIPVLIETGSASMIMVYAIGTAVSLRAGESSETDGAYCGTFP